MPWIEAWQSLVHEPRKPYGRAHHLSGASRIMTRPAPGVALVAPGRLARSALGSRRGARPLAGGRHGQPSLCPGGAASVAGHDYHVITAGGNQSLVLIMAGVLVAARPGRQIPPAELTHHVSLLGEHADGHARGLAKLEPDRHVVATSER